MMEWRGKKTDVSFDDLVTKPNSHHSPINRIDRRAFQNERINHVIAAKELNSCWMVSNPLKRSILNGLHVNAHRKYTVKISKSNLKCFFFFNKCSALLISWNVFIRSLPTRFMWFSFLLLYDYFEFILSFFFSFQKSFTLILQALDMFNTSYPGKTFNQPVRVSHCHGVVHVWCDKSG